MAAGRHDKQELSIASLGHFECALSHSRSDHDSRRVSRERKKEDDTTQGCRRRHRGDRQVEMLKSWVGPM